MTAPKCVCGIKFRGNYRYEAMNAIFPTINIAILQILQQHSHFFLHTCAVCYFRYDICKLDIYKLQTYLENGLRYQMVEWAKLNKCNWLINVIFVYVQFLQLYTQMRNECFFTLSVSKSIFALQIFNAVILEYGFNAIQ